MAMIDEVHRPTSPAHRRDVARAQAALLDPAMAHIVDLVLLVDGSTYTAAAVDGHVRFRAVAEPGGWLVDLIEVEGRDPLGDQRTDHLVGLDAERSTPFPNRRANA